MATALEIIIKAKDEASGTVSGIENTLGGLGKGLGLLAGGVGILGGIGAALGKLAIDAAPLQLVRAAFDGLAMSAGIGGDAMLLALEKGSNGMIAQEALMKSFNKAAQLVGTDFAVNLPQAMQYLSKVSAATGQDMGFMLDSLVTGIGRLSPMILDNLGVQVSLEQATARAAEMFGVEAAQLTKAQQQAGMMDVVLQKLAANTASMPEIAGTAAQSWAQMGIAMQNLADQVGLALLPAITPVFQQLAKGAAETLPQIVARFQEFGTTMSVTMGPAMLLINDAWMRIMAAFGQSAEPLNAIQLILQALGAVLDALVIGVQAFAIVMQGLATAVEAVSTAVQFTLEQWAQLVAMFQAVEAFAGPQAAIDALQSGLAGLNGMIASVIGAWESMASAFQNIQIPAILTPGSPTPMELGLRGISDALREVAKMSPGNIGGANPAPAAAAPGNIIINLDGRQIFSLPSDAQRKMGGTQPL